MNQKYGYIYLTTNLINDKKYIGQRKGQIFNKNYKGSGKIILKALKKYGRENFEVELLEWCYDFDQLQDAEEYWIAIHQAADDPYYYNIKYGGSQCKFPPEIGKKISRALRKMTDNGLTVSQNSHRKRNDTLKDKDPDFLKTIGIKSSKTQILNGKHAGRNNHNFCERKIVLMNYEGKIVKTFLVSEVYELFVGNNDLPKARTIIMSLRKNLPMFLANRGMKDGDKFYGWVALYEDEQFTIINPVRREKTIKKSTRIVYEIFDSNGSLIGAIRNKNFRSYCEENVYDEKQFRNSYRTGNKIKSGKYKGFLVIKKEIKNED